MANWLKQGDAFALPVAVRLNGELVAVDDVETLELCVGNVRKLYPGEVRYSPEDGNFYMPLRQEETLRFPADEAVAVDLRVRFKGGDVLGARRMCWLTVYDAASEQVL